MQIIINDNLPREVSHYEKERFYSPKWFASILNFLGIDPFVEIEYPVYEEEKAYMLRNNVVICSSVMAQKIREQLPLKHLQDDVYSRTIGNPVQYRTEAPNYVGWNYDWKYIDRRISM